MFLGAHAKRKENRIISRLLYADSIKKTSLSPRATNQGEDWFEKSVTTEDFGLGIE